MAIAKKHEAALDALLVTANGRRRKMLLTLVDLERVVADALESPHGIAVRHGGVELLGKTTLALAVVHGKQVTIGVGTCWADRPSPGRLWKELQPWQQDLARNVDKARAWAGVRATDRITMGSGSGAGTTAPASPSGSPSGSTKALAKLFAQILAKPEDDALRLVYADALQRIGDPRGELIAVQCALVGAKAAAKRELGKREAALLRKHRKTWMQEALQVGIEGELERGFVGRLKATAAAFANHGARLFEHEPLEHLVVSKPTGAGLEVLGNAPHLARLRRLQFSSPLWVQSQRDVAKLAAFLRSPHLGRVRELDLTIGHDLVDSEQAMATLFDGVAWPAVTSLAVHGDATVLASLPRAKLPALRTLDVSTRVVAVRAALRAAFPKAKVG